MPSRLPARSLLLLASVALAPLSAGAQAGGRADGATEVVVVAPVRADGAGGPGDAVHVVLAPTRETVSADPGDVASVEAIVTAAYEAIQRAPGETFDWDRFRTLFIPQATLIPNAEQSPGGTFLVYTPETFVSTMDSYTTVGGPNDRGFAEEGVHLEVHRYGDVAQAFSTYQKHFWGEDRILGRGINSFQLVFHSGRWWIASIAWDEENGAGPIPPAYGGEGH